MNTLAQKRILLGVTGGIAAYKSADLVRRLKERGAEVQVVMTRGAHEFITPLTFQALSGRPVYTELLDHDSEAGMGHISLARWCDLILVAPATANFMARLAHGMADDLLTAVCLATDTPLMLAPAMNRQMWLNPATADNLRVLADRGISVLGPAAGDQACGETGPGRMLEPADILKGVAANFHSALLTGTSVLVTAGPTREAIDPVRYLSNHSSGRMGYAVALAALEADAEVTLVSGPVGMTPPERARFIQVDTALEMQANVLREIGRIDIFISAAAVADYRPVAPAGNKIKKGAGRFTVELEKNPDILAMVAGGERRPFTVGFAAETDAVVENARRKLEDKRLDMIAANQVGDGQGFGAVENALEVLWRGGGTSLGKTSKEKLARGLIRIIADRYHETKAGRPH